MIPISHILEKYLGSSLLYTNIVEIFNPNIYIYILWKL